MLSVIRCAARTLATAPPVCRVETCYHTLPLSKSHCTHVVQCIFSQSDLSCYALGGHKKDILLKATFIYTRPSLREPKCETSMSRTIAVSHLEQEQQSKVLALNKSTEQLFNKWYVSYCTRTPLALNRSNVLSSIKDNDVSPDMKKHATQHITEPITIPQHLEINNIHNQHRTQYNIKCLYTTHCEFWDSKCQISHRSWNQSMVSIDRLLAHLRQLRQCVKLKPVITHSRSPKAIVHTHDVQCVVSPIY